MTIAPLLAGVTFLMVLAIILGAYWVLIVRPEGEELWNLRARLRPAMAMRAAAVRRDLLRHAVPLSMIGGFSGLLVRAAFLTAPLQTLITQSGIKTTVGAVVLASGTLFVAPLWAIPAANGSLLLAFPVALLLGSVPALALRFARARRVRKFEAQFPEAVDLIARSLRAGHAFSVGLKLAGDEVPEPIGSAFRLLHDRHNYGQALPQALREFADTVMIIDARFFATAVLTQREAGGNLAEVLDHLSSVIRDRFRVKREVQTKSAHGRMTGIVIGALPPFMFLYLWLTAPNHVRVLMEDPLGVRMIVGAACLELTGLLVIRKLVDIRY